MEQLTYKAERRTIYLGDIPLQVAMLPNGDYCLSQTEVAGAIDKFQSSINRFLGSKSFKGNGDKAFELTDLPKTLSIKGANKPITPISIKVACLYWYKWAAVGNEKAEQLVWALLDHSISDLADKAFDIKRTAEEKNQAFKDNLNSDPEDYLNSLDQSENILKFPEQETLTERELKLKIRLAELELEKIRSLEHPYNPRQIRKIGVFNPEVLIEIKDKLKLKNWEQAEEFLDSVGFGSKTDKWMTIRVTGNIQVLPWQSVKELRSLCHISKTKQK